VEVMKETPEQVYTTVYTTVDIILYSKQNQQILLGKKKKDGLLWRFPGGFSDVTDISFESDALRELREETHVVGKTPQYIGSTLVDDERYRESVHKIKTILFLVTDFDDSNLKADDDLVEVKWFHIDKVTPDILVPNHRILWQMFLHKCFFTQKS
jgi:ADP-ribose pyrophosphatase YjhB (NUDIX family)